ncbi:unnamed protein product [Calicophoron daubneyi]|uniref:Uncharacterized protein n=1 Tax=Calicophoron daubneyi TaxID=300641 RepID=A0AAV2TR89_CALDB
MLSCKVKNQHPECVSMCARTLVSFRLRGSHSNFDSCVTVPFVFGLHYLFQILLSHTHTHKSRSRLQLARLILLISPHDLLFLSSSCYFSLNSFALPAFFNQDKT